MQNEEAAIIYQIFKKDSTPRPPPLLRFVKKRNPGILPGSSSIFVVSVVLWCVLMIFFLDGACVFGEEFFHPGAC